MESLICIKRLHRIQSATRTWLAAILRRHLLGKAQPDSDLNTKPLV